MAKRTKKAVQKIEPLLVSGHASVRSVKKFIKRVKAANLELITFIQEQNKALDALELGYRNLKSPGAPTKSLRAFKLKKRPYRKTGKYKKKPQPRPEITVDTSLPNQKTL